MPNKSEMIREIFSEVQKGGYIHPMKLATVLYENWMKDHLDREDVYGVLPDLIERAWIESFSVKEIEICYEYTKLVKTKSKVVKQNLIMKLIAMCFSGPVNYDIPQ